MAAHEGEFAGLRDRGEERGRGSNDPHGMNASSWTGEALRD